MGGKWVPEHPPSMRACQQFPLASFATIIIVAFVCGEQLQLTQAMPTFSMTKAMEAHKPIWFPAFKDGLPSQANKVFVITGTTTGTGHIAARVAAEKGGVVLMLNRPSERATKSLADLTALRLPGKLQQVDCDLQDLASVRKAAAVIKAQYGTVGIDVLCCNAGVMALADEATKDGYDIQMQTNHLSHFVLCKELMPLLTLASKAKGEARIVSHSSLARYQVSTIDAKYYGKNGGKLGGNGSNMLWGARWVRYGCTKLANAVFTYALADKLTAAGSKVKALVAAPGLAATNLQATTNKEGGMADFMVWMLFSVTGQSAEDGAMPLLSAMCAPDAQNGDFYEPGERGNSRGPPVKLKQREGHCNSAKDKEVLWTGSVECAGGDIPIA